MKRVIDGERMILIYSYQHGEFSTTFNGIQKFGNLKQIIRSSICARDRITPMAELCIFLFKLERFVFHFDRDDFSKLFIFAKRLYLSFFALRKNECPRKVLCPFEQQEMTLM